MSKNERKVKKEIADGIMETIDKIIPGIGSFLKKAEKSIKFGPGIKEIREEINRRFSGLKK